MIVYANVCKVIATKTIRILFLLFLFGLSCFVVLQCILYVYIYTNILCEVYEEVQLSKISLKMPSSIRSSISTWSFNTIKDINSTECVVSFRPIHGHFYLRHKSYSNGVGAYGSLDKDFFDKDIFYNINNLMTWHGWPIFYMDGRVFVQAPIQGLLFLDSRISIINSKSHKMSFSIVEFVFSSDHSWYIVAFFSALVCCIYLFVSRLYRVRNYKLYSCVLLFCVLCFSIYGFLELMSFYYAFEGVSPSKYVRPLSLSSKLSKELCICANECYLGESSTWMPQVVKCLNDDSVFRLKYPLYGLHYLCTPSYCGGFDGVGSLSRSYFSGLPKLGYVKNIATYRGFPLYVCDGEVYVQMPIQEAIAIDNYVGESNNKKYKYINGFFSLAEVFNDIILMLKHYGVRLSKDENIIDVSEKLFELVSRYQTQSSNSIILYEPTFSNPIMPFTNDNDANDDIIEEERLRQRYLDLLLPRVLFQPPRVEMPIFVPIFYYILRGFFIWKFYSSVGFIPPGN